MFMTKSFAPSELVNCLRFAHPAEADWRLEVGKSASREMATVWNRMELNGIEQDSELMCLDFENRWHS